MELTDFCIVKQKFMLTLNLNQQSLSKKYLLLGICLSAFREQFYNNLG